MVDAVDGPPGPGKKGDCTVKKIDEVLTPEQIEQALERINVIPIEVFTRAADSCRRAALAFESAAVSKEPKDRLILLFEAQQTMEELATQISGA